MYEIKIYKSKWKAMRLILFSLLFISLSIYNICTHFIETPRSLDWFCLCFFGLGVPIGIFNLLDRRPEMILNENGIFDRMVYGIFNKDKSKRFITWDSIEDAWIKTYQPRSPQGISTSKQKLICIKLNNAATAQLPKNKLSKSLGLGDYNIPLVNLKKFDEQKFLELIKGMRNLDVHQKNDLLANLKVIS